MPEKEEKINDKDLISLKDKYQQIKTDAKLDWDRLERYENLAKHRKFIVKLLKLAACFVAIGGVLVAVIVGMVLKHVHDKIKSGNKMIAFSSAVIPHQVKPKSMPGPGGMGTISAFMSKQNVSVRPDFNKIPSFSMPSMVSKKPKKDKGKN